MIQQSFDFNGLIIDDEPLQMAATGRPREQSELTESTTTARSGWTTRRLCARRLNVRSTLTDDVLKIVLKEKVCGIAS